MAICGNGNFKSEEAFVAAHIFRANNHCVHCFQGCAPLITVMEAAHLRDGNGASKFSRLHLWAKPLDLMHAEYLQRESACGNSNW